MMLTRFALLAVVVVALTEAFRNPCDEIRLALRPDKAACKKEWLTLINTDGTDGKLLNFQKCQNKQFGWVTDAGVLDEAALRTYIAGKMATATTAIQNHVNSRLDDCLIESSGIPKDSKFLKVVDDIIRCLMRPKCGA